MFDYQPRNYIENEIVRHKPEEEEEASSLAKSGKYVPYKPLDLSPPAAKEEVVVPIVPVKQTWKIITALLLIVGLAVLAYFIWGR